jgi:hypothetical protein
MEHVLIIHLYTCNGTGAVLTKVLENLQAMGRGGVAGAPRGPSRLGVNYVFCSCKL